MDCWKDKKKIHSQGIKMAQNDWKEFLWISLVIAVITGAILYFILKLDLIPNIIGIWGYIDEAIVIGGALFVLNKYRKRAFPKRSPQKFNWKGWLIYIPIIMFFLWYIFHGQDLIPDTIPLLGYLDDAIAVIAGVVVAAKIRNMFKKRK
jgi:uncharacterized membrane protein YkvA (DUF1232 family)